MSFPDKLRLRFQELRAAVERGDRFARLRLWIAGALGADILITVAVLMVLGMRSLSVDVRFVEAFPSNQIMLQNQGGMLHDVEVTIDGRYKAKIAELPPGSTHAVGLEMDREFRDAKDTSPPRDYRPRTATVRAGAARIDVDLTGLKK